MGEKSSAAIGKSNSRNWETQYYANNRGVRPLLFSLTEFAARGPRIKSKFIFRGGVYVAKYSLREPRPKGTGLGRPDG